MTNPKHIAVVEVKVSAKHGCYHVYSPDMPELHLCGDDVKKLTKDVPEMIKILYKLNYGSDVVVTHAAKPSVKPSRIKADPRHFLACPQLAAA